MKQSNRGRLSDRNASALVAPGPPVINQLKSLSRCCLKIIIAFVGVNQIWARAVYHLLAARTRDKPDLHGQAAKFN